MKRGDMMQQTDIESIKGVAKSLFMAVDIKPILNMPIICQHPFTTSTIIFKHDNNNITQLDLTKDTDYQKFKAETFDIINSCTNISDFLMLIQKSYYLTFLKYSEPYLSLDDFSSMLAECWTLEEFPNRDVNVTLRTLISWFKKSNKEKIMTKEEYTNYEKLIDKADSRIGLTVYRGISHDGKVNGLSWTTDINKAKWFANRFSNANSRLCTMTIYDKSAILAYFNGRNENEVIINTTKCKNWTIEKL